MLKTTARVAAMRPRLQPKPVSHADTVRMARLRSMLTPLLLANVVAVPLLVPRFAGNSAPPDIVMIPFTAMGAAALWRMRTRIRLPLGAFYLMILLGGILAVTQSIVPKRSTLAVIQDAYLFVWFLVIVNYLRDGTGRTARLVAGTWVAIGAVIGTFTWLLTRLTPGTGPYLFGFPTITVYGRSSATFEDPNLAGNYLVITLFVLWASPWPASRRMKIVLTVPFLLGIYSTQSITAIATLLGGTIVALLTGWFSRRSMGLAAGLAVVGAALLALTFLPSDVGGRSGELTTALGETGTFQRSLGRTQTSLGPRLQRIEESFQWFGSDILIGIGPSATSTTLSAANAPVVGGEIHNDYAAGFIERGILGGLGVIGLFASAFVWSAKSTSSRALRAAGWRPTALTGAIVAVMLAGFSLETLHFRHVWLLFALTIALALGTTNDPVRSDRTGSFARYP